MQVGKTKDQGLYNKPSAAVHLGALAAGTVPQYSTIPSILLMLSRKTIAVYCKNSTKHITTLYGKRTDNFCFKEVGIYC